MNFVKNFYRSVVKVHPQTESSPSGAMYLQRENGKVMLKVDPNAEKTRREEDQTETRRRKKSMSEYL